MTVREERRKEKNKRARRNKIWLLVAMIMAFAAGAALETPAEPVVRWWLNGTTHFVMDSSGEIGVNIEDPSMELEVNGTFAVNGTGFINRSHICTEANGLCGNRSFNESYASTLYVLKAGDTMTGDLIINTNLSVLTRGFINNSPICTEANGLCIGGANNTLWNLSGLNLTPHDRGYKVVLYGGISSMGAGNDSEVFGNQSTAGHFATALGFNATAGNESSCFGYNCVANFSETSAFGTRAKSTAVRSTAFGTDAVANGNNSLAIGQGADVGGKNATIVLGVRAKGTADNSLIIGSNDHPIRDVYVGTGQSNNKAAEKNWTLHGVTSSLFTGDKPGGSIRIAGGKGQGTSEGGSVIFQTAPAGIFGGSFQNPLQDQVTIDSDGRVGIGISEPGAMLDVIIDDGADGGLWIEGAPSQSEHYIDAYTPFNPRSVFAVDAIGNVYVDHVSTSPTIYKMLVNTSNFAYGIAHRAEGIDLSTYIQKGGGGNEGAYFGTVSNHKLHFYVNNGFGSLVIDQAGDVGIGTTNADDDRGILVLAPTGTETGLHVIGNLFGSGNLTEWRQSAIGPFAYVNNDAEIFDVSGRVCTGHNGLCNQIIGGGIWNKSGNNVYPSDLNFDVGIGTNTPQQKLNVDGDANVTGNFTGNFIIGEMYIFNNSQALTMDQGIPLNLSVFTAGQLNGFTQNGNDTLTPLVDGVYKADFHVAAKETDRLLEMRLCVNGKHVDPCSTLQRQQSAARTQILSHSCFVELEAGDLVTITINQLDDNKDIIVEYSNVNLMRVGGN